MAAGKKPTGARGSGAREQGVALFSRLKDLVRQLEEDERKLDRDQSSATIAFKLRPNQVAWFVAYSTAGESVAASTASAEPRS